MRISDWSSYVCSSDLEASARRFAEEARSLLVTALLVISALCMAGMPWFIYLIGSGFSQDPEKLALAVDLTRITFPYLLFMAVVALLSGVPHSLFRLAAAAAAPKIGQAPCRERVFEYVSISCVAGSLKKKKK